MSEMKRPDRALVATLPSVGEVRVVEGTHGMWHYHLARVGEYVAACGDGNVMNTSLPVAMFGREVPKNQQIPESHCTECMRLAGVATCRLISSSVIKGHRGGQV